jgi:hypothetical protein
MIIMEIVSPSIMSIYFYLLKKMAELSREDNYFFVVVSLPRLMLNREGISIIVYEKFCFSKLLYICRMFLCTPLNSQSRRKVIKLLKKGAVNAGRMIQNWDHSD